MSKRIKDYRFDFKEKIMFITEEFEKKAGIIGTPEYEILLKLRKDYPDFTIEHEKKKKITKKNGISLKADDMIKEIKKSTDDEVKNELENIEKEIYTKSYYGKIKKLYFETYPERRAFRTQMKLQKDQIKKENEAIRVNNINPKD